MFSTDIIFIINIIHKYTQCWIFAFMLYIKVFEEKKRWWTLLLCLLAYVYLLPYTCFKNDVMDIMIMFVGFVSSLFCILASFRWYWIIVRYWKYWCSVSHECYLLILNDVYVCLWEEIEFRTGVISHTI